MTYTFTEKREQRVLAWVNRIRVVYKIGRPLKHLPRGKLGESESCPLARALRKRGWHVRVYATHVRWRSKPKPDIREYVPQYVQEFIDAFDEGACSRLRKLAVKS